MFDADTLSRICELAATIKSKWPTTGDLCVLNKYLMDISMEILKEKGIYFPENFANTLEANAIFLEANKEIDSSAGKYLVPGLFLLYCNTYWCEKAKRDYSISY